MDGGILVSEYMPFVHVLVRRAGYSFKNWFIWFLGMLWKVAWSELKITQWFSSCPQSLDTDRRVEEASGTTSTFGSCRDVLLLWSVTVRFPDNPLEVIDVPFAV